MNRKITIMLLMMAAPALAHHAAPAFFGGEIIRLEGTLRGVKIINPHSYFRVTLDDGIDWVVESQQSGTLLKQLGYTAEMFANGRRIIVTGDANNEGRKYARWRTVTFFDGDDIEVCLAGRIPDTGWVADIRGLGTPSENGIDHCFRVAAAERARISSEYVHELLPW